MSWVTVGVVGGSALLGAYTSSKQQQAQAKQNQANMMAQAAQTRYSPWTGAKPEVMAAQATDPTAGIGGAIGGGMTGLQQFAKIKEYQDKLNAPKPPPAPVSYNGMQMAGGAGDMNQMNPWDQMAGNPNFYKA